VRGIRLQGGQPCRQAKAVESFDIIPIVSSDGWNNVVLCAYSNLLPNEEKIDLIEKQLSLWCGKSNQKWNGPIERNTEDGEKRKERGREKKLQLSTPDRIT